MSQANTPATSRSAATTIAVRYLDISPPLVRKPASISFAQLSNVITKGDSSPLATDLTAVTPAIPGPFCWKTRSLAPRVI